MIHIDSKTFTRFYYNAKGNIITKTPESHPYSYDTFVVFSNKDESKITKSVYSDRLYQYDSNKYDKSTKQVFGTSTQSFQHKKPELIEQFLRIYFEDNSIQLKRIQQSCNISSGYPLWVFEY